MERVNNEQEVMPSSGKKKNNDERVLPIPIVTASNYDVYLHVSK